MLRAVHRRFGRVALLHFDAHLDTWDTYFGAPYTHGTPFRRAAEEGLLAAGSQRSRRRARAVVRATDLSDDRALGFEIVRATDFDAIGVQAIVERIRARLGDSPVYVSVDIDVLDPGARAGHRDAGSGVG